MASLTGFAAAMMIAIAVVLAGDSSGRDLRPSDHGLGFQASPPANSSMEMRSFFSSNRSSSSSSSSDVSPRNVTESLPPALWRATGGGGGSGGKVGRALLMASLVCGVTGGVLLVASALLYLFKRRRNRELNESFGADNDSININANKLELVRNP